MADCWKITIVGGSLNGTDFSFPPDKEVLIGRSSKADVRLSGLEADVSGRHVKLVRRNGVPTVVNVSGRIGSTFHCGVEMAPDGGSAALGVRDEIELGASRSVRVRIDSVPGGEQSFAASEAAPLTAATNWGDPHSVGVSTAIVEESTVLPSQSGGTALETRVSGTFATNVPRVESKFISQSDGETIAFTSGMEEELPFSPGEATAMDASGGDRPDGETIAPGGGETVVIPRDEINIWIDVKKRELENRRKKKRAVVMFCFAVLIGMFAALWFSSRTDGETDRMAFPLNADGKPDVATYAIKDRQGQTLVAVDYPRDDGMSVTESPDGGVTVVSAMGRDRDVPFFLQLETVSREDELKQDLISSVRSWMSRAEESGQGYVFDIRVKDGLEYRFFEDVFPGCCQEKSLYGVKFVMFDYKRTWADGDKTLWHGVLVYFRLGDTAFIHRREIPETFWVRGGYRIEQDPNIAIYSNFIDSYWESSGMDGVPADRPISGLMESVRGILDKERASDWRYAKKNLDAILANTWRTDPKMRDLALGCLRQFREVLRTYYYGKYNAFDAARENRDEKRMAKIRNDAAMVFDDPGERYYHLVANGEVW